MPKQKHSRLLLAPVIWVFSKRLKAKPSRIALTHIGKSHRCSNLLKSSKMSQYLRKSRCLWRREKLNTCPRRPFVCYQSHLYYIMFLHHPALPDYPDDFSHDLDLSILKDGNLMRGIQEYYYNQVDENGIPLWQKDFDAAKSKSDAENDAMIAKAWEEMPIIGWNVP